MHRLCRLIIAVAGGLLLSSCGDGHTPTNPLRPTGLALDIVSGDRQTGTVGTALAPLIVKVTENGNPVSGQVLNFRVTSGNGSVYGGTEITGQKGLAQEIWTLGTKASEAQTVEVRAVSTDAGSKLVFATFNATATADVPAKLIVSAGDQQNAIAGTAVGTPPAAEATDQYGNPIAGVDVTFTVSSGGGSITGGSQVTNAQGIGVVGSWTLGAREGNNTLNATSSRISGSATFHAAGVAGTSVRLVATTLQFSAKINTVVTPGPSVNVTDVNGNGIPNMAVTFTVRTGGGSLDGVTSLTTLTDVTGSATANWTLGPAPGTNTLQATAPGLQGSPITLTAKAFCDCWSTRASMPLATRSLTASALNGILYAIGGYTDHILATVRTYDPTSDLWSTTTDMNSARIGPASAVLNGRILVVGGFNGGTLLTSMEAYDPATRSWTNLPSMSAPRWELSAGVIGNVLYAVGGDNSGNGTQVNTLEAYDATTNTWTTKRAMPTDRFLASAGVIDGLLYIAGGFRQGQNGLRTLEVYDPGTDTWSTRAPMPTARFGAVGEVVDGVLYVIGGQGPNSTSSTSPLPIVEAYDPKTDTWTTKSPMITGRLLMGSGVLNGYIFTVGGSSNNETFNFATNEAYLP